MKTTTVLLLIEAPVELSQDKLLRLAANCLMQQENEILKLPSITITDDRTITVRINPLIEFIRQAGYDF